ncbi:MAG: 4-(cytidine 5'-diphospho)-2-C-methyl-D-erythritol kinase [Gammaproteobacteria bacterium]
MSDPDRSWPAPAKLNLMLRITGRRANGFHDLQTVFQFLDFGDELCFRVREDGGIRRTSVVPGVDESDDLTIRAARLLQKESGVTLGAELAITKRIPMGGGLGGGSSDAATTLVALNHLWQAGLSVDQLADLGLRLGADVPVFVRGEAAWAEGVGERLRPVSLREPWYLVITPDCAVSTAAVFSAPRLTRDSAPITIADFLSGGGGNDCLSVVREAYPEVAEALDWLDRFAPARLTGTGSSLFAEFPDREAAEKVMAMVPQQWRGVVARGLNRSPLLDRLGEAI